MTAPVTPVQGGTTSELKTSSWDEVLKTLRRTLLDYQNTSGDTARDVLVERLYQTRAPDAPIAWPYGVMRLETQNDGRFHGMRLTGNLEVQLHGRPWSQSSIVNQVADLFDQAMLSQIMRRQGLIFCHGAQRAMLPPGGAPIDAEVVTVRLAYTLAIWPAYLTSLTYVLPPSTSE